MPLYDSREFVKAFRMRGIDILVYAQRNVGTGIWEVDFCNKVTKESLNGLIDVPIIAAEKDHLLLGIDTFIKDPQFFMQVPARKRRN